MGRRPVISTAVDFQARSHRLVRFLAQTLDTEAAGLSEAEFSAHLRRDPVRGQAFCRTEGNHSYSRHAVRMTSILYPSPKANESTLPNRVAVSIGRCSAVPKHDEANMPSVGSQRPLSAPLGDV